ncbi:MAG TPA: hypothetical protein VGJ09_09530 [Bryobacteraceae bacterium]|jgi:hypothetical protein
MRGKRAELVQWLERERPACIGKAEFAMLRAELGRISTAYLRRLLRESGVPLNPLVEGVRQDTFEALESSLLRLFQEYEHGDAAGRTWIRKLVIEAKDHARWAARKPERRVEKEEMVLWMLTWLENPPLFPQWVQLRRKIS